MNDWSDLRITPMGPEEARVRAMVEHAQASSWEENLQTAARAQERFMLPGRFGREESSEFVRKIDRRAERIMINDRRRRQEEEERQKQEKQSSKEATTIQFWK